MIEHKFVGFHNTKEVVSVKHKHKITAEIHCKQKLLNYFHKLQDNVTRFPLENYQGEIAYVGYIEELKEEEPIQLAFPFPELSQLNS